MLDTFLSIIGAVGALPTLYDFTANLWRGDNIQKMLAESEKQTQLQQRNAINIERLSENILYASNLQSVRDTSRTIQQIETDNQAVYDALRPVQQALGGDILSSAMILTPEQMRQAMNANPWDVLQDIQPAAHVRPHNNSGMVPILFEHEGSRFIGWQMRGVLPMLFNVEYSSSPSGLTVAQTVAPPSAKIEMPSQDMSVNQPPSKRPSAKRRNIQVPAQEVGQPLPTQPKSNTKIDFDWVHVPAGEFKMGCPEDQGNSEERPQHNVYLDNYHISRVPVTNGQYAQFIKATGHRVPRHWENGNYPSKKANHPVVYVSWHDAQAFCKWAGVQLPTEAQWEKAARGTDGRIYPWGNTKPDKTLCNFSRWWFSAGDTTEVGQYPKGASPYGCLDMAGNVWEWVADWYDADYYKISSERSPTGPEKGDSRVLRGGSWSVSLHYVRAAYRYRLIPGICLSIIGFRVLL